AVAAMPLVVTVVRPGHLLLLLLPMTIIATVAWRERRAVFGWAVVCSWVLMGPAYLWYTNLVAAGFVGFFVRPGEEVAIIGATLLWLTCVMALLSVRAHRVTSLEGTLSTAAHGEVSIPS
ncbi:MAG TPA: hypothetical protein VKE27_04695, partial [Candidatus Dormibacteraeota bacterium]|nr:hypothetical protein [Candidatus Dormibacteraeota bacterium]